MPWRHIFSIITILTDLFAWRRRPLPILCRLAFGSSPSWRNRHNACGQIRQPCFHCLLNLFPPGSSRCRVSRVRLIRRLPGLLTAKLLSSRSARPHRAWPGLGPQAMDHPAKRKGWRLEAGANANRLSVLVLSLLPPACPHEKTCQADKTLRVCSAQDVFTRWAIIARLAPAVVDLALIADFPGIASSLVPVIQALWERPSIAPSISRTSGRQGAYFGAGFRSGH